MWLFQGGCRGVESLEGDPASEGRGLIPGDSGRCSAHGLGGRAEPSESWGLGSAVTSQPGLGVEETQNSQKSWLYFAACFKFFKTSALLRYS